MSAPPDPTLPRDPADYRPRPLMGLGFWALIAFGLLCVLAGAGVALLGPRFFPPPQPQASPAPQPAALTAPNVVQVPAPGSEVDRLNARIAELESSGARSSEAAAAALAAAVLLDASQGSRPFAAELAAVRNAAPDLAEVRALTEVAATGAPSRAALAASFPDYAGKASSYARKPQPEDGLRERVIYALSKVMSVRRVSDVTGSDPDALIARAELALQDGDVAGAVALIDKLPERARRYLAPWREGAARRAEVDRRVGQLRARAIEDLGASEDAA